MAIVLMVGSAYGAGLLQGVYNHPGQESHFQNEDGSQPGVWEYDCIYVWGITRCHYMTQDGSGIVGYLGQTEVTPASLHQSGNANTDAWQASWWNTRDGGTMGVNNPDLDFLVYDLGAEYSIDTAYLWPGSQDDHADVSIRDFSIAVSTDTDPRGASWTYVTGNLTLAQHPTPGADIPAQAFGFDAATARLVMIDVASAYHSNGWAGLSEAAFGEAAAHVPIPEPAGLGVVGLALLAMRRRRS